MQNTENLHYFIVPSFGMIDGASGNICVLLLPFLFSLQNFIFAEDLKIGKRQNTTDAAASPQ